MHEASEEVWFTEASENHVMLHSSFVFPLWLYWCTVSSSDSFSVSTSGTLDILGLIVLA